MPSLSTSPVDPKEMLQDILNAIVTSTDNRYIDVVNEFNKYLGYKDEIQQKHILSELITYQTKNRIYITARNALLWPTLRTRTNDPNFPIWLKQIIEIFSNGVQNNNNTVNELFCIINEQLLTKQMEKEYFTTCSINTDENIKTSQGFFDILKSFIGNLVEMIRGLFVSKNPIPTSQQQSPKLYEEPQYSNMSDIEKIQEISNIKNYNKVENKSKSMFFKFKNGVDIINKSLQAKAEAIKKTKYSLRKTIIKS